MDELKENPMKNPMIEAGVKEYEGMMAEFANASQRTLMLLMFCRGANYGAGEMEKAISKKVQAL